MMMQMAKGGGCPGCRGCPGMPGGGKRAKRASSRPRRARASAVSGNPAKAAAAGRRRRRRRRPPPRSANPFGNPDGEEIDYEKAAAALDLPKDFSKFLK